MSHEKITQIKSPNEFNYTGPLRFGQVFGGGMNAEETKTCT